MAADRARVRHRPGSSARRRPGLRAPRGPGRALAAVADAVDLHPSTPRFHLDALVRETEKRDQPGRPRALYRATAAEPDPEVVAYQSVAGALMRHLASAADNAGDEAEAAGFAWGTELADERPGQTGLERVVDVLGELGYQPTVGPEPVVSEGVISDFDAIIVAGGRGSRLGGLRKPELVLGGRRLVDIALSAAAGARRRVVVGDIEVPEGVLGAREDPPYGGPVEAVDAGMARLDGEHAPWTLLLAGDLPDAEAAVARLLTAVPLPDDDGLCLLDADGRLQWLLGCYRTEALRARLADRGDPPLTAMHRLLSPLRLRGVDPSGALVDDVDTAEDARRWGIPLPGDVDSL
jgi:molybdopterin-guanine dinucleotide biosynthesis protein A